MANPTTDKSVFVCNDHKEDFLRRPNFYSQCNAKGGKRKIKNLKKKDRLKARPSRASRKQDTELGLEL